jgi:polyisoprenoid-binding protein YceI
MKRIALILLMLCAAAPAQAAKWTVNHAKSHLGFSVQWQDHPLNGEFKSWDADIDFDPADVEHASATIKIDLASVTIGGGEMDTDIKGPQGFDTANFSTATFQTTWFRANGKNSYVARGNLTLHGITRGVTLPFKLDIKGNTAHMAGTADLLRTDFHIGMGHWAGENPVAHQVTVIVDLTAKKMKTVKKKK